MRVLELLDDLDVVELDVEVLVDALEHAADLDVILQLDRDLMVDEGLEEAVSPRGQRYSFLTDPSRGQARDRATVGNGPPLGGWGRTGKEPSSWQAACSIDEE